MLIGKPPLIPSSEITPRSVYLNRRRFLAAALAVQAAQGGQKLNVAAKSPFSTSEPLTPYKTITTYNNFYEFGTDKAQPAELAKNFRTSPWSIKVEGAVNKPGVFDLDALRKLAPLEERIYRHRCVEGWSIVVPWIGYPLQALLKVVDPKSNAKYVAFKSFYDSSQMPAGRLAGLEFPYVEGLRMDEAMHPLALLCFGLYGETLPNQNGAPVRLVVPWKYGFKSIKSIASIKLVQKEPSTTWNLSAPREYGFYSNVNPEVNHPRWSQASERRLGDFFRRNTLMFNGYGDQITGLYAGMDLRKNY